MFAARQIVPGNWAYVKLGATEGGVIGIKEMIQDGFGSREEVYEHAKQFHAPLA